MPSVMAQDQISENLSGTAEDLEAQVTEGLRHVVQRVPESWCSDAPKGT